jgi:hypothetical protein
MSQFEMQNLLDDYKEQIPDDLYLKLSNLNMKIKNNSKSYYKALYLKSVFRPQPYTSIYKLNIEVETRIIQMTQEEYDSIQLKIDKVMLGNFQMFALENNNRMLSHYNIIERCDNEEDKNDEVNCECEYVPKYKKLFMTVDSSEYLIKLTKLEESECADSGNIN